MLTPDDIAKARALFAAQDPGPFTDPGQAISAYTNTWQTASGGSTVLPGRHWYMALVFAYADLEPTEYEARILDQLTPEEAVVVGRLIRKAHDTPTPAS